MLNYYPGTCALVDPAGSQASHCSSSCSNSNSDSSSDSREMVAALNALDRVERWRPASPYASQPAKALYMAYKVLTTFLVKQPYWYLRFLLFPDSRFPKSWSVYQKVQTSIHRSLAWILQRCDFALGKRPLTVLPDAKKLKHSYPIWIDAPPSSDDARAWKVDDMGQSPECDADFIRLPGYVYGERLETEDRQRASSQKVILFFHGGALAIGTAHESDLTAAIPINLVRLSDTYKTCLSVEYRLTTTDAPFPAQIVDCVSGYAFLLSKGFSPSNIVISGDSAGGHLALAVTRYLLRLGQTEPAALVMFSPWTDMSTDLGPARRTRTLANESCDFLNLEAMGSWPNDALVRTNPVSIVDSAWLSPAGRTVKPTKELFAGYPPCWFTAGTKEALLGQIRELKRRLDVSGVVNELVEFDDCTHDFEICDWFPKETRESAFRQAARFIDSL